VLPNGRKSPTKSGNTGLITPARKFEVGPNPTYMISEHQLTNRTDGWTDNIRW